MTAQQSYTCPQCGGQVWRRIESDIDPDSGRPTRSETTFECQGRFCGTISAKEMAAHVRRVKRQLKARP